VAQVWGYVEGTKEWRLEATLSGHSDWVRDAAWAPNVGLPMSTIASCGQDGKVLVWTQSVRTPPPRHVTHVSRGANTSATLEPFTYWSEEMRPITSVWAYSAFSTAMLFYSFTFPSLSKLSPLSLSKAAEWGAGGGRGVGVHGVGGVAGARVARVLVRHGQPARRVRRQPRGDTVERAAGRQLDADPKRPVSVVLLPRLRCAACCRPLPTPLALRVHSAWALAVV
jgi:hypothetical protein